KNRRTAAPSSPTCPGVDLNRNYDFLWNFPLYFHPSSGVRNSTDPCDYEVYIGPSAFSEPETRNVLSLLDDHANIRFYVDVHSFSQRILYVWGDDENQATDPSMNFQNAAFNGQRGLAGDAAYKEYVAPCNQSIATDLG